MEKNKSNFNNSLNTSASKDAPDTKKKRNSKIIGVVEKKDARDKNPITTAEAENDVPEGIEEVGKATEGIASKKSNNATAKVATTILENQGYKVPTKKERLALLVAFAKKGAVIYGKAFDLYKAPEGLDLLDENQLTKNLSEVKIFELKSTNRPEVGEGFSNYFFSMSTAELLVAQSLKKQFSFVMVNIITEEVLEMSLSDVFKKTKGIHPSWSIRF